MLVKLLIVALLAAHTAAAPAPQAQNVAAPTYQSQGVVGQGWG